MASSSPPSSLLSKSLASASSLVLLQLFSRVFTFVLNQALVRLVSPKVFGTAAIQFELLLSTILFLSREGVRNALLRATSSSSTTPSGKNEVSSDVKKNQKKNTGKSTQSSSSQPASPPHSNALVTNISFLPILLGIPITILTTYFYIDTSSFDTSSQPHFRLSVFVYAFAAFFELLSEPLYIRAQNDLRFDVRVRAEGSAVVLKTFTTVLVLALGKEEWALLAFALGQAAYGFTTLVAFGQAYRGILGRFWIKRVKTGKKTQYFDGSLLHLSAAMTGQSVIKHFLTEGDKFLVSRLSPLADQGGYAVASNYGSLAARIVFQPIEETSRVFFSKTLSAKSSKDSLQTASTILSNILLLFTHLFLLLVTFAPPYLPLAVKTFLPPRFQATSAPSILQTYIYYIPMMAFNGILEAFFASTATPSDLRVQSRWMLIFSIGFVGSAILFTQYLHFGDAGLVYANVLNLFVRAAYAWVFVNRFYAKRGEGEMVGWRKAVPPVGVLGAFMIAGVVTRWSQKAAAGLPLTLIGQFKHINVGVACVAGCLGACVLFERRAFMQVYALLRKR